MSSMSQITSSPSLYAVEDVAPVSGVESRPAVFGDPASEPLLVVVPCFNEEAHVADVVGQLLAQENAGNLLIVIVDGASTDRTAEIARRLAAAHPSVRLISNPARLQSAAVNLAVRSFGDGFRYLARLDAHAAYPRDYCIALLREAMATLADSVVVGMRTEGRGFVQSAAAVAQNSRLGNGGSAHRSMETEGRWVDHGHHALIRIAAFRAVGGYDESFSHNEDAEFDMRLTAAGYRCWLTRSTHLVYYPRDTVRGLFRQYFNYGRGRARTATKHRAVPKIRQMLPLGVAPAVVLALFAPVHWILAVPALAWAGLCIAYGLMLAVDRREPAAAASGPAAMVIHLAWSLGFWRQLLAGLAGGRR